MQKNVASQKIRVFAFNETDNTAVTGDAANITIKVSNDWAALAALTDVNPTETEDGYYVFDATQAETNYDNIDVYPESSTANIQVIGVPGTIVTVPANHASMGIESDGDITKVNLCANTTLVDTTTTNTDMAGTDNALLASSAPTNFGDMSIEVTTGIVSADMQEINSVAASAVNLEQGAFALVRGQAVTGTLTTTTFTTNLTEATDDHYNGRVVTFTSGVLNGQSTDITDYTGSSKLITVTAMTEAPSNTDTFVIS